MRLISTCLILLTLIFTTGSAFAAKITFSFDDAPKSDNYLSGAERAKKLLKGLENSGVEEAVFYANPGRKITGGIDRLKTYGKAGHIIANHTYNHPNLNKVTAEFYIDSIKKAHNLIKDFATFRPWFRYPYLREGAGYPKKHDQVKEALKDMGYQLGYVTIEIYDWRIEAKLRQALQAKKKVHFDRLEKFYRQVIVETSNFYEEMAQKVLGRSPVHVILLHENDINAMFLEAAIGDLKDSGFTPAKASEAFDDQLANSKWDSSPRSMRRLRLAVEATGYTGNTIPKWVDAQAIDKELERLKIFE